MITKLFSHVRNAYVGILHISTSPNVRTLSRTKHGDKVCYWILFPLYNSSFLANAFQLQSWVLKSLEQEIKKEWQWKKYENCQCKYYISYRKFFQVCMNHGIETTEYVSEHSCLEFFTVRNWEKQKQKKKKKTFKTCKFILSKKSKTKKEGSLTSYWTIIQFIFREKQLGKDNKLRM